MEERKKTLSVEITKRLDIEIELNEVIQAVQELNTKDKMNVFASILNSIEDVDFLELDDVAKKIVRDYLKRQLIRIEETIG